ncbi:UNVERIFIED_ORG: hypothetical protein J2806_004668 [Kosakonia oryzae]|nr:hypothetical protein [Kosakonia oryzae]
MINLAKGIIQCIRATWMLLNAWLLPPALPITAS